MTPSESDPKTPITDPSTPISPDRADRLAAIDIGSNTIRLVVAEVKTGGAYRILDDERESTRLARTLNSTGELDEEAIRDSLAALRRLRKITEGYQVEHLRTIATCAVREADNGREFIWRVKEEAGLDVEVISCDEEAKLAFLSTQRVIDLSDRNVALADIGGGSTEIVFASGNHIQEICPTSLGAVRLTERFGGSEKLFDDNFDPMVKEIDRRLKRATKRRPFVPQLLIGTGGTFTTLSSMLTAMRGEQEKEESEFRASRADIRHLLDRLKKSSIKDRRSMPGLNADRADIIVAGLAIVDRIMRRLKVNMVQVHAGGVRDGLLLTMIDRLQPAAESAVDSWKALESFATGCGVDLAHARHVADIAVSIFDQLAEAHEFSADDRRILRAGAILSDVGYLIRYSQHHKHSYQLIVNSQLPGFRRDELALVANVARYHRGAKPKKKHENFRRLDKSDRQRIRRLVAILRLAAGFDRSHSQNVSAIDVSIATDRTRIHVSTTADPEVDLWAARQRADMFEKVFNTRVSISLARAEGE